MAGEEENIEMDNTEENAEDTPNQDPDVGDSSAQEPSSNERITKLPITRVKAIMKSDPDVSLASSEAVVALAKAAEMFIQMLSKDAINSTMQSKRKTLQRKDLDTVIDTRDSYAFLEGTLDGP
ncbi:DNA polymerase epsilon subunit 4-like [Mizuhopecten yessoensis]|uniref:DNA polymerase epsilon subunit 4 n=1 Tax=Mizuhopecten yessoensis TaxID=6573 RepID=A0A210QE26_MIZYE|nr:DNA polymerase epsilon subunit 4-like [Mizuhopecten yessoensis]OWF46992.1 DNA polymerase epsilon subunit 4 [Mizuhopecten yessoensis]